MIKVRVFGDDREARVAIYNQLCDELNAAPIQHIGKLLVLFRPKVEKEVAEKRRGKSGGPKVNYQGIGSGGGRKAFINETVAFGASDDPISEKDIKSVSRGVVQIPTVGGSIAVAYNKSGCSLKLTQKQVVSVFMGSINNWKQLGCADGKITVVHRSDGSGTTAAFTESLQSFSKEWTLGNGKSVN